MTDSWTIVSAIAAGVGVPVAIGSVVWQIRQSRLALGVDLLLRFEARFDEPAFRSSRQTAAEALMQGPDHRIDDVIDFFETVGLLTRRRVLNPEVIWNEFSYWVFGYWLVAKDYITGKRADDPLRWVEFEWLYKKLFWIEFRKRHRLYALVIPSWLSGLPFAHRSSVTIMENELRAYTHQFLIEERGKLEDAPHLPPAVD